MEEHPRNLQASETPSPPFPSNNRPGLWLLVAVLLFSIGVVTASIVSLAGMSAFAVVGGIISAAIAAVKYKQAKHAVLNAARSITTFEYAQQRLVSRQKKRAMTLLWFGIFGFLVILAMLQVVNIWPLTCYSLFMVFFYGLQVNYYSPQKTLPDALIEQEMGWLFGEDWRKYTGSKEYVFAQDRIRERRLHRWLFAIHFLVFVVGSGFILDFAYLRDDGTYINICLALPLFWAFGLLLPHAIQAFPTARMLWRRESRAAHNLPPEFYDLYPIQQPKNEEKAKTDKQYRVGDDGELVEIEGKDEALLNDEKPKREQKA